MKMIKSSKLIERINKTNVYDVAVISPITEALSLSSDLGNEILLKREDLQPVFSFKLRGAYNKISKLYKKGIKKPVIAASAGNHAQGVAFAAKKLKLKATIVMPVTTPSIKVNSVRRFGAKVMLYGDNFDEAFAYAKKLSSESDAMFIHPYDDLDVIAGQGTIGKEIMDALEGKIDAIFVPVGGGGLLAGLGSYVKFINPKIKIYGVEPDDAACLDVALKANKRVSLKEVGLFADGVAVKQIGEKTFSFIKEWVDGVVTVSVDEMCAAVQDTFQETRSIPEPAGALALAGLKKMTKSKGWKNKRLLAINSGANLNFDRLPHIVERVQLGEKKEALLSVKIPEEKGSFRKFCKALGKRMISEFNYRVDDKDEANIFVACRFNKGKEEKKILLSDLKKKGYLPIDLSENEVAKLHVKHMVGGRAPQDVISKGELLFRVRFPEKPGALIKFLDNLSDNWNITLFHYRNQGAAYGRVLVGFQAKPSEKNKLIKQLKKSGYPFWDETSNAAYSAFLK
jgi:threonine dehydratase